MEYRRLGRSGLHVSALSFGSWVTFSHQMDVQKSRECMVAAYDAGVNFFDNAEAYANGASETIMGEVLRQTAWPRDSYIVSSKVMFGSVSNPRPTQRGLSHKHVVEACHQALRRLNTEYLDLYFCHRPDPETPLEETVRAMDDLVHRGKVHYWGTSVWPAELLDGAHDLCDRRGFYPPLVEQPQYSLLERGIEASVLPAARRLGMGLVVWSPLAGGLLTGKYDNGVPPGSRGAETRWLDDKLGGDVQDRLRAFSALAHEAELSPAQLALAWILRNDAITSVITGATSTAQVESNLQAAEVRLDDELAQRVEELFPA